ncbi:prepilin peptidase [Aquirhabdus parva]|uniref:Prepilin leader peptidase/N-methyltransferase n=1 Tax=Aquirhabdus parva TaxID=2283318 RepID=A0A345PAN4_9GAMM|nr:A24 family peptidase [Aquirhabdus parva]AXI04343.1 prepilin peptidase [Aquirhabdus parva]
MQNLHDALDVIIALPWLSTLLIALLGLCVGSFLNVVIYRLPRIMESEWHQDCSVLLHDELQEQHRLDESKPPAKMTLSQPASTCPSCGHKIRWYENIPLLSWLVLRGKCSACKTSIGIRYPLVELLTMLASLAVFLVFGPTLQMLCALGLTWALIALTGIDFDTQYLPDRITLPLAAAGLLVNAQSLFVSPSQAIWGYVIGFLVLWIVYILFKVITGKEGMGYGDFKLLAALGAWLGPMQLPLIILLSSFVGAIIGIILLKVRKENQPFAFGPYIAIAGWISLLWGNQLVTGYLGMYH